MTFKLLSWFLGSAFSLRTLKEEIYEGFEMRDWDTNMLDNM